ncbi:DNA-binding winged helix-turn-helix (wHTH) protein [Povalibacter uvarum]|uniref:DNA-binding winged helix-turn-helix (WHTH) protein n=1 Tax=Povalibacter uvarum TaxID=732238 RepID=A0A841HPV5_9GAMM|nr:tetratricopeptide repeat protein [Povalibacter uvarum]MBB6095217.1 DNA-binding winged helix-turn-helix (wHTH) protein [Povalibacter uvarum]
MAATDPDENLTSFRVGDWLVDPIAKQISREGEIVRIDPRNLRVLTLLASRAGQVVPQREIESIAWSGLVVTPDSIYQSIAQLRRALGEQKSKRYIDTVSRKGYRLVAAVSFDGVTGDEARGAVAAAHTKGSRQRYYAIAAALTAAVALAAAWLLGPASTIEPEQVADSATSSGSSTSAASAPPSTGANTELPQAYQGASHYRRAIKRLLTVLDSLSESVGENDLALIPTLMQLGNYYPLVSDPKRCEEVARRGLAILVQHGREVSSEGVELNSTLAEALTDTGRYAEAEHHLRRALEHSRQVHGDAHYSTVNVIDQWALLRIAEGRPDEAVVQARRAIAAYQQVPERVDTRNAYLISTLTWALIEQGRYDEAIEEARRGYDAITPDDPPAPYLVAYAHHFLAEALLKTGELEESEQLLRREIAIFETIPHCEMDTARAESALAESLMRQGRLDEAQARLERATDILKSGDGWRERKSRRETQARIEQLLGIRSQLANPAATG